MRRGRFLLLSLLTLHGAISTGRADAAVATDAAGLEKSFTEIADKVGPAVVSVVASYTVVHRYTWGDEFMDEFFKQFFEGPGQQYEQRQPVVSAGSGVIVNADGTILTNAHVIGRARTIMVKTLDQKEYKAKLVGKDDDTDLAVLKIVPEGKIAWAALGDSDAIKPGQWSIAIGNPFGLENTMTVGVISAKGRKLDEAQGGRTARFTGFIQTDASINRGNSGGPLLNLRGEVIGINSMIFSPSGGSVGIGFAIPVNLAKTIMEGLIKEGKIVRPQLGVAYRPVDPAVAKKLKLAGGMEVSQVLKNSAAEKAGIKAGDIILTVNRKPLKDQDDLRSVVLQQKVGDKLNVEVHRRGKTIPIVVVLKEMTPAEPAEGEKKPESGKRPGESSNWLGMTAEELTAEMAEQLGAKDSDGVIVTRVQPDSRAAASGISRGDVIREIEQQPVKNLADFDAIRQKAGDKDDLLFLVERRGATMYIVIERKAPAKEKEKDAAE